MVLRPVGDTASAPCNGITSVCDPAARASAQDGCAGVGSAHEATGGALAPDDHLTRAQPLRTSRQAGAAHATPSTGLNEPVAQSAVRRYEGRTRIAQLAAASQRLFGTAHPGKLEPLWAQDFTGAGLLRDYTLTAEEDARPVTVSNTSESLPTKQFRDLYPDGRWPDVEDVEGEEDLHAMATTALAVGEWPSSVLRHGTIDFVGAAGDVSTNQSAGVPGPDGDDVSASTLYFGSAGNNGSDDESGVNDYPAAENSLSVGSADALGFASDFTTRRRHGDVVAAPSDMGSRAMQATDFGGTSGASPMAAGVGATVHKVNSRLSALALKAVLVRTADPPRGDDPRAARLGHGTVNLQKAVAVARYLRDTGADIAELQPRQLREVLHAQMTEITYAEAARSLSKPDVYAAKVRELYRNALLEPAGEQRAKEELAKFYDAHGVVVSSHRWRGTRVDDPKLVADMQALLSDPASSRYLKALAVRTLHRAGALTAAQLEELALDPKTSPMVAVAAARILARSGRPSDAVCQHMTALRESILGRKPGDPGYDDEMEGAAFGSSELLEPLGRYLSE